MKTKIFIFIILASIASFILSAGLYADEQLFINTQSCNEEGEVTFTISVRNIPEPINALGFEVQFDSSVLQYKDFDFGSLTHSMNLFNANLDESGESIIIGGFSYENDKLIPQGSTGTIIELIFSVIECQNSSLVLTHLMDNIKGWTPHVGHLLYENDSEEPLNNCRLTINDQSCTGSGEVTFSVSIDNTLIPIEAFGFEVYFDPSILNYKRFTRGNLVKNFNIFDVNFDQLGNCLMIGGFSYEQNQIIPQGSTGTIVGLTFSVLQCKKSALILTNLIDDLENCLTKDGSLTPKETSSQLPTNLWGSGTSWSINPFGTTSSSGLSPFSWNVSPSTQTTSQSTTLWNVNSSPFISTPSSSPWGTSLSGVSTGISSLFGTSSTIIFGGTTISPSTLFSPSSLGGWPRSTTTTPGWLW
ncbi:MAG: cohesin domain-containing protein [bacterium]